MKLVFIRHGETNHNTARILIGQKDPALNEKGIKQSLDLSLRLRSDFQVIYSSPLRRARGTAEIICRHLKIPLILRDNLKERHVGSLAGGTWEQINEGQNADLRTIDASQEYDYRPFGGESAEQVRDRILKFIEEAISRGHHKVLAVCHAGVIRLVYYMFSNAGIPTIRHASVHEFEFPEVR